METEKAWKVLLKRSSSMYMHAAKLKGTLASVGKMSQSGARRVLFCCFLQPSQGAEQFSQAVNVSSNTLQMHFDRKTLCSTELSSNVRVAVQEQGNKKEEREVLTKYTFKKQTTH